MAEVEVALVGVWKKEEEVKVVCWRKKRAVTAPEVCVLSVAREVKATKKSLASPSSSQLDLLPKKRTWRRLERSDDKSTRLAVRGK